MNNELIEFITSRTHLKANEIKPDLRLAKNIGLYGLDSIGFFEEFFNEFEIEKLEEFDVNLHIDGGTDFAPQPLNWIKNLMMKKRRKYLRPDVTVGHLEKVIERGEWIN